METNVSINIYVDDRAIMTVTKFDVIHTVVLFVFVLVLIILTSSITFKVLYFL